MAPRSSVRIWERCPTRPVAPLTNTVHSGCGSFSSKRRRTGRCPCRRHSSWPARVLTISHPSRPGGTASTRRRPGCAARDPSRGRRPRPGRSRTRNGHGAGAVYDWMGRSDAPLTLAALEDLWLEPEPQNRPGTPAMRPISGGVPRSASKTSTRSPTSPRCSTDSTPAAGVLPDDRVTADDLHLFNEGTHFRLYDQPRRAHRARRGPTSRCGRRTRTRCRCSATSTAWTRGADPLEPGGSSGIWAGFVPGLRPGEVYKYHIVSRNAATASTRPIRSRFQAEIPPRTASVVWDLDYDWNDGDVDATRGASGNALDAPMSIYEVHLGSWRARRTTGSWCSYRELAPPLAEYVRQLGFTHVELMPVMEHPFYGSWGYQTTGYFAPTSRYGTPQDLMTWSTCLHQSGHRRDPRLGAVALPDRRARPRATSTARISTSTPIRARASIPTGSRSIFNYGRNEVRVVPALERDASGSTATTPTACASTPSPRCCTSTTRASRASGSRTSSAAARTSRRSRSCAELNEEVYRTYPDVQTIAEESTAWPMVSRPTYVGGLGFGMKWDMGWMHDTLQLLRARPGPPPVPPQRAHVPDDLRVHRELRAAAVARRGRARQGLADRQDAGRRLAAVRQPAPALRATCTRSRARSCCSWAASSAQWREWNHDGSARLAPARRRGPRRRAALGRAT